MSQKTQFAASINRALSHLGGAHLTHQSREGTAVRFVEKMASAGVTHLRAVEDISGKQLRMYIALRKDDGVSVRTLQNEMSHLRAALRDAGRNAVATAPELSNASLGIAGGSRLGTKEAITAEKLQAAKEKAIALGRDGIAQVIHLQRTFGLRENEAICARADTLLRWELEVSRSGSIRVLEGTKGGRDRDVRIFDRVAALGAISSARAIADRQGGFLVQRADGDSAGELNNARGIYAAWAARNDLETHSLRYAFAQEQYRRYRAAAFSNREALVALSRDLGHGDGRGRWVKMVYLRGMDPSEFE
jgi:hypothetical protein